MLRWSQLRENGPLCRPGRARGQTADSWHGCGRAQGGWAGSRAGLVQRLRDAAKTTVASWAVLVFGFTTGLVVYPPRLFADGAAKHNPAAAWPHGSRGNERKGTGEGIFFISPSELCVFLPLCCPPHSYDSQPRALHRCYRCAQVHLCMNL